MAGRPGRRGLTADFGDMGLVIGDLVLGDMLLVLLWSGFRVRRAHDRKKEFSRSGDRRSLEGLSVA